MRIVLSIILFTAVLAASYNCAGSAARIIGEVVEVEQGAAWVDAEGSGAASVYLHGSEADGWDVETHADGGIVVDAGGLITIFMDAPGIASLVCGVLQQGNLLEVTADVQRFVACYEAVVDALLVGEVVNELGCLEHTF